jgi:tRNA threonylcarbamoyladenosine biosynthesis protein TsaB
MAFILIIETSTEVCSVALTQDGRLMDLIESSEGQNHARLLSVFIDDLLVRNHMRSDELSAVAVSRGPGSYTGLRIGVSTAKGICYAAKIPLIAIGTLESMAMHVSKNRKDFGIGENRPVLFCPMLDARRMEVYSMIIDGEGRVLNPVSAEIIDETFLSGELADKQVVFFGNGSEKCKKVITSSNALYIAGIGASASYLCELAQRAFNKNDFEDVAYFEPFYLKDFVTTVSRKNVFK